MLLRDLEVCLLVFIEIIIVNVEALVFFEAPIFRAHLVLLVIVDSIHRNCKFSLTGLLSQHLIPPRKLILLLRLARHSPIQLFRDRLVVFSHFFCDLIVLLRLVRFMFRVLVVTGLQVAATGVLVSTVEIHALGSMDPFRVAVHGLVVHFNL